MNLFDDPEVSGFTFTLFSLRKLPGEPKYSITIRYMDDRDTSRGKGASFDACVAMALKKLPTGKRHLLDDVISEMTFHHANLGVSGLSRLPGEPKLFCNMRRSAGGDLHMGRGHTIEDAITEAMRK